MEFLFKCSTCYLVSESSERVRYRAREYKKDKHEKRSFISASDHLLFYLPCKHNRPLLGRKVDFLKNEIIGFTIRKKKSYSASAIKLKMKKSVEPLQKQKMGVAFFSQNSQLLTFSYQPKKCFHVNGRNRPVANLSVVDFRSQPQEIPLPRSRTWL